MSGKSVALFVTCLADLFRPSVAFATIRLLEENGFKVHVPDNQICCGQPAYNSGDSDGAKGMARQIIQSFATADYVVAPSGSCAAMIKKHYPVLFKDDAEMCKQATDLSAKTYELTQFLTEHCTAAIKDKVVAGSVTIHDSCSGLRELGIKQAPRDLLSQVEGLEVIEHAKAEECCGFGGTFCVKYPAVSNDIVSKKAEDIIKSDAAMVTGGDLGCLMHIAGKLKRMGSDIEVRHIAEILAGDLSGPALGEGASDEE